MLVRQGDDEVECLTIEITAGQTKLRCVNGYGPQIGDPKERKAKFWNYLDGEVNESEDQKCGLVIEIDSNSWAGSAFIPNDPNIQNGNGKLLELFLQRNKGMTLVNSLPLCKGLITRKRMTENRREQAAMDFFIVCKKVLPLVIKMHVDEQGEHQFSNFHGIQHNGKVIESDHAMTQLKHKIQFAHVKPTRTKSFNFKSDNCQKYFKSVTTNTNVFTSCFETTESFPDQVRKWQRNLKLSINQSFYKIR